MKRDYVKLGAKVVGIVGTNGLFGAALSIAQVANPCGMTFFAARTIAAAAMAMRAARIVEEELNEQIDLCCEVIDEVKNISQ